MPYTRTVVHKKTSRLASLRKRKVVLPVTAIVLLLVVIGGLELGGVTDFVKSSDDSSASERKVKDNVIPETKSQGTADTSPTPIDDAPTTGSDKTPPPPPPASTSPPKEPYGNFVSSHKYVPSNVQQESVCVTTPGASCSIRFTAGSVTKTLPEKTTDANGAAYWNWSADQLGLTAGSWSVSATASLNGQTTQATDPNPLEVQ